MSSSNQRSTSSSIRPQPTNQGHQSPSERQEPSSRGGLNGINGINGSEDGNSDPNQQKPLLPFYMPNISILDSAIRDRTERMVMYIAMDILATAYALKGNYRNVQAENFMEFLQQYFGDYRLSLLITGFEEVRRTLRNRDVAVNIAKSPVELERHAIFHATWARRRLNVEALSNHSILNALDRLGERTFGLRAWDIEISCRARRPTLTVD